MISVTVIVYMGMHLAIKTRFSNDKLNDFVKPEQI